MTVNGGYGVVLQLTEAALQASLEAFVAVIDQQLSHPIDRQIPLLDYAIREDLSWIIALETPRITLKQDRTIGLTFAVRVVGSLQTRLDQLPGGALPPQPPTLAVGLLGEIDVEVEGIRTMVAGSPCLALDLAALNVTRFYIAISHSTIAFSAAALAVISAIARRAAIYILSKQVSLIPLGFEFDVQIPILGDLHIPVTVDYKIVVAGDGRRALAIMLQVMNEVVDRSQVSFAIDQNSDFAALLSLGLIELALDKTCASLEGYRLYPNSGGIKGDLILEDVHMHVVPGTLVLDGVKVQSRTLERIEKTVEKVICTALDPCNLVCRKVFETVIEWVQLDQLAHASGDFSPYIDTVEMAFRVHASNVDVELSLPLKVLIFTAVNAILPVGSWFTLVAMVVGQILANRYVTGFIEDEAVSALVDKSIPGTHLRFHAAANQIGWPDGCMALNASFQLVPA